MTDFISINKEVPVVGQYDVVVCGGGPAGFIAALAAARKGASVALVERFGFLGGMATAGLVAPLSVFTYNNEQVIGGIPWDFIKALEKMGGAYIESPLGNVAFDPELYKLCMQRMALEAGVSLYMNSYLSGCMTDDGTVTHIIIENKNGTEAVHGKMFVDATGDADLAHMAGMPMQDRGDAPLQPCSTYFILSGVDTESPLVAKAMHHNMQGVNCHCLPVREKLLANKEKLGIPEFGGPWFCTTLQPGTVAVNMTRTSADYCDNRDFTAAECRLREDVYRMAAVLKENVDEFKNSYVSAVATQAGPRETRRIKGAHTISAEEYVNAYRYEDSISRGAHPIDIHKCGSAEQSTNFLKQAAYVPYRALYNDDFSNLLVAGRCLSADRMAFASLRVQGSCMGTGQAAGLAAAMCAMSGIKVSEADVPSMIATLKEWGAAL